MKQRLKCNYYKKTYCNIYYKLYWHVAFANQNLKLKYLQEKLFDRLENYYALIKTNDCL